MANFTTEAEVRAKFQLTDATLAPAALVSGAINDAHTELMRFLDPGANTDPPADGLVLGETLLAGAHLFRSLASKDAFTQKRLALGSNQLHEGSRFKSLLEVAAEAEREAWHILEPYLQRPASRRVAEVTDSQPVLGEG